MGQRQTQGRVVGEAQIAAKPDDGDRGPGFGLGTKVRHRLGGGQLYNGDLPCLPHPRPLPTTLLAHWQLEVYASGTDSLKPCAASVSSSTAENSAHCWGLTTTDNNS